MNQDPSSISVLIAIQARSNSSRLPGKIYEYIGEKRVLQHVIDSAKSSANHVQRFSSKKNIKVQIAVLHPHDDKKLVDTFKNCGAMLLGGPEDDVLRRYVQAQEITNADYVVRLTSDCPLILDFIITKHINVAVFNDKDYVSNVEEGCRSSADGFDCEVMSRRSIEWLFEHAQTPHHKEHVTSLIRELRPNSLAQGFVSFKLDTSHMKMSLDTKEDLERIRQYYHQREHKMEMAHKQFGRHNVYEL